MPRSDAMTASLGCARWASLPATDLDYDFRGGRTSCALEIAFRGAATCRSSSSSRCAATVCTPNFSRRTDPGLHHLGFLVDDIDAVVAHAEGLGYANVQGATFGSLTFCYLDTWNDFGLFVELVHDPDEMMQALMPWR